MKFDHRVNHCHCISKPIVTHYHYLYQIIWVNTTSFILCKLILDIGIKLNINETGLG